MKPTSKAAWLFAAIIIGIVLVAGLWYIAIQRPAIREIARHRELADQQAATLDKENSRREPILDPSHDGNAWSIYQETLRIFSDISQEDAKVFPSLLGSEAKETDDRKMEEALQKLTPALELLRAALSCTRVDPDHPYRNGATIEVPEIAQSIRASKVLADAARLRHRQGRDRDAIEIVVLNIGMSHDMERRGFLVHHLVRLVTDEIALKSLTDILDGHSLTREDLDWLSKRFERLASSRVTLADCMRNEQLITRFSLLMLSEDAGGIPGMSLMSRNPLTRKKRVAEALQQMDDYYDEVDRALGLDDPDAQQERIQEIQRTLLNMGNEIVELFLPDITNAVRSAAENIRHLALARRAIEVARGQMKGDDVTLEEGEHTFRVRRN